jgi:hypothetical protein
MGDVDLCWWRLASKILLRGRIALDGAIIAINGGVVDFNFFSESK